MFSIAMTMSVGLAEELGRAEIRYGLEDAVEGERKRSGSLNESIEAVRGNGDGDAPYDEQHAEYDEQHARTLDAAVPSIDEIAHVIEVGIIELHDATPWERICPRGHTLRGCLCSTQSETLLLAGLPHNKLIREMPAFIQLSLNKKSPCGFESGRDSMLLDYTREQQRTCCYVAGAASP